MSHPGLDGLRYLKPMTVGEIWENPVNRESMTILEVPWQNHDGRWVAELSARVGARVVGEHLHPAIIERFTPLEGEL